MKKGSSEVVFLVILLFITVICLCGVLLFYNLDKKEVEQGNNSEVNNETSNNDTTNNTDTNTDVNTDESQTDEDKTEEDKGENDKNENKEEEIKINGTLLESKIKEALIEKVCKNDISYTEGLICTEGHKTLKAEIKDNQIYAYVTARIEFYELDNNVYVSGASSGQPLLLIFDINSKGEYVYSKYVEPKKSGNWTNSVKELFPSDIADEAIAESYGTDFYENQIKKYLPIKDNMKTDLSVAKNIGEGHVLKTQVGKFIISKAGKAYYIPDSSYFDSLGIMITGLSGNTGVWNRFDACLALGSHAVADGEVYGQELDLTNVKSAKFIEYGNAFGTYGIIFIHNDGSISEFSMKYAGNSFKFNLYKKISGLKDIVAVAQSNTFGGNYAILMDKKGTNYAYFGENNTNLTQETNGYMTKSDVGRIIIDKDGSVYLTDVELSKFVLNKEIVSNDDFIKGKYTASSYDYPQDNEDIFEGYKINVSNIRSAYCVLFGNNTSNRSLILVSKDGKVNELQFRLVDSNKVSVKLIKDISRYNNIVNVVQKSTYSGDSVILFDVNGNQYNYFGADN